MTLFDDHDVAELARTKVDGLTDLLRWRIQGGDMPPGYRLPAERDLAAALGVSRDTVRHAIARLVEEGYAVSRRGQSGGAYLTDLAAPADRWLAEMRENMEAFEDLYDFRIALETRAATLAAQRRTDGDLDRIEEAIDLFSPETWQQTFRRSNWRFHDAVDRASHSRRIEEESRRIRGLLWLPPSLFFYERHVIDIADMHRRVFHAIRDRDVAVATRLMEAHLENGRVEIRLLIMMTDIPLETKA
jgi:GntR family transcriptional regulator, transcriptional repressor for pyruvate dehydrogenase complex